MGEMSRLGCLTGWSSRDMWADSLCFLYVVLDSYIFCGLLRTHVGIILNLNCNACISHFSYFNTVCIT
jgi:hypothetical protein